MSAQGPTDQQRELLAEVDMGLAAEQFLRSKLGKYMVARAAHEAETAIDKLKIIDPNDVNGVRALQNDIWRGDSFATWITDLIRGGKTAEHQLTNDSDDITGD